MTTPAKTPAAVKEPQDVLALVPHALGFRPADSLVFLIMAGPRLLASLRVDLPPEPPDPRPAQALAEKYVGFLLTVKGATGAFVAVYSHGTPQVAPVPAPDPVEGGAGRGGALAMPYGDLAAAVLARMAAAGLDTPDAWHVGPSGWRSYLCLDPDCCPPEGLPLEDLELSTTNLDLLVGGSAPSDSFWDGSTEPAWEHADTVRAAVDSCLRGFGGTQARRTRLSGWCAALALGPEEVRERLHSNPLEAGSLLAALHDTTVRDLVLFAAAVSPVGARQALEEMERGGQAARDATRPVAGLLLGTADLAPDWEALERLRLLCRSLLGAGEGRDRFALLCLLAWMEWAKGRGSAAAALLETVLDEDPDYTLAVLFLRMIGYGRLPAWVGDGATAWKPDRRDEEAR